MNHIQNQAHIKDKVKLKRHQEAVTNGYMFGATSRDLLKTYFSYNLKFYFSQGFRVKVYIVPDDEVIKMGNEAAFPVKYHHLKTTKNVEKRIY